jgi:hypothetical protein
MHICEVKVWWPREKGHFEAEIVGATASSTLQDGYGPENLFNGDTTIQGHTYNALVASTKDSFPATPEWYSCGNRSGHCH